MIKKYCFFRKSYNKRHEKYKRRTVLMDELRKAGY